MSRSNNNPNQSSDIPTESYFERYKRLKLEGKGETIKKAKQPLKRAAIAKSKHVIKKVSDKRAKQEAEYRKLSSQFKKDNPYCKAVLEGCQFETHHIHHMKGRIGALLTDLRYFLPVCNNCHHIIETQPKTALELNLSVLRLKKDL